MCETDGCSSEAKLQCPTCIKLGIQGSYFCSQVDSRFPRGPAAASLPSPLCPRGRSGHAPPLPRAGSPAALPPPPSLPRRRPLSPPGDLRPLRTPAAWGARGGGGAGALPCGLGAEADLPRVSPTAPRAPRLGASSQRASSGRAGAARCAGYAGQVGSPGKGPALVVRVATAAAPGGALVLVGGGCSHWSYGIGGRKRPAGLGEGLPGTVGTLRGAMLFPAPPTSVPRFYYRTLTLKQL